MALFGPKACLGIDIGVRDIRVVELSRAGGRLEVTQAARIAVPENGNVSAALRQFILDTETSPGRVTASLPTHLCSVKFAQIPKAKAADLARMARFEAESQIPLPLGDVVWDFSVDMQDGDPMRHLVIGGARRSDVEQALTDLEGAELSPDAIMVSVLAAAASLDRPSDEPVLLAQIGEEWTDFCLLQADRMLACRTVRIGGKGLIEAFAQDLGAGLEEAEEAVRTRGLAQLVALSGNASAIENWADTFALEVRRSVVSVPSREPDGRPQTAVLVGECADVPGFADDLARRAGMTVKIGDPWSEMSVSSVAEHTLRENPAAFAAATGLARAAIEERAAVNLMPHHRSEERLRRRKEVASISVLGVTAVVLMAIFLGGRPGIAERSADLSLLRSEVAMAKREMQRAGPNLRASASNVTRMVQVIEDEKTSPLELLRRMSTVLPRGVWLSDFAFERDKTVVLKGTGLSNSAIADSADAVNQLALFKDVTLDFSSLSKNGQTYDFQITCSLPTRKGASGASSDRKSGSAGGQTTGIVVQ